MTDFAGYVFFCIVGQIFIYLWMEFPLPQWADNVKFIHDAHACSLCSGVYLYTILAWILKIDILQMMGFGHFDEWGLVTGGCTSFLVHLLVIGFREKFLSVVIT